MDNTNLNDQNAIIRDSNLQNQKIKSVPKPKNQDTDLINKGIASQIAEVGDVSKVDISAINSFTSISQTRDQLYQLLDVIRDAMVTGVQTCALPILMIKDKLFELNQMMQI